jgi:hypothetical protein
MVAEAIVVINHRVDILVKTKAKISFLISWAWLLSSCYSASKVVDIVFCIVEPAGDIITYLWLPFCGQHH